MVALGLGGLLGHVLAVLGLAIVGRALVVVRLALAVDPHQARAAARSGRHGCQLV